MHNESMKNISPIIYEDRHLIVFNKPGGISVLGDEKSNINLWDIITREIATPHGWRPYQVHRLDKGTSGVWIVAKHQDAQRNLTQQFQQRQVEKIYLAGVGGKPLVSDGYVDKPIEKARKGKYRISNPESGHVSMTRYSLLWTNETISLLRVVPETGRTHQIRVHLRSIGLPIIGDRAYGGQRHEIISDEVFMLHCHQISSILPSGVNAENQRRITFTAELPEYFTIFPLADIQLVK